MENHEYNYADVKVRAENLVVSIPITSISKPEISVSIKEKWQKILDITARCMSVPAALIMQIHEHEISVLVSSRTLDNPYSVGSSEELRNGLYCETVLGKNSPLYVPDAMDSAHWCDNPDIKLGMRSYLGFPVRWPDGEFFGTICVLDTIENPYMQTYAELMVLMQEVVERDLEKIILKEYVTETGDSAFNDKSEFNHEFCNISDRSDSDKNDLIGRILNAVRKGLNVLAGRGIDKNDSTGTEIAAGMMDMTARLNNILCLIDLIYNSPDRRAIPIEECARMILENIKDNYQHECANISFGIDIPSNIAPGPDIIVSCCMIISEVVINSVTHAFTGNMNGEVYIMMRENRPGDFMLHISDNGKGIFTAKRNIGSGMAMIEELVRGLNGTVNISSDKGTSYYIDFRSALKSGSIDITQ